MKKLMILSTLAICALAIGATTMQAMACGGSCEKPATAPAPAPAPAPEKPQE